MAKKKNNTKKKQSKKAEAKKIEKIQEIEKTKDHDTLDPKPVIKIKVAKGSKKVWNARARNYFRTNKI
jgi:hypothetical protein